MPAVGIAWVLKEYRLDQPVVDVGRWIVHFAVFAEFVLGALCTAFEAGLPRAAPGSTVGKVISTTVRNLMALVRA